MLYLLVFGVTFENWNPFGLSGTLSITRVTSVFYILSCIPFLKSEFQFQALRKYIIPLFVFVVIALVATAFNGIYANSPIQLVNLRLLQLILLMFFVSNHILSGEIRLNSIFYAFVFSMVFMYLLFLLGTGVEFENGRLLLFGENPNVIGMKSAIAVLILIAILLDQNSTSLQLVIFLIMTGALLHLLILTASRGALASVVIGLITIVLFSKMHIGKRVILALAGTIAIFGFVSYILVNNPIFAERILSTIESGDTGRNHLWKASFEIIGRHPFMGVGIQGVIPEMFKYSGKMSVPHNIFLWTFIATGIFGLIAYLCFLGTLVLNLLRKFKMDKKIIYILLFVVLLFNMSKAGGSITKVFFWFFFAILIGSTANESKLKPI